MTRAKKSNADRAGGSSGLNRRFLIIVAAALLAAFIVSKTVVSLTIVVGESMISTLEKGSWVLADRLAYNDSSPEKGDIVVFRKTDVSSDVIVKRIAAVPGDTVEVRDGLLYVDGVVYEDSFGKASSHKTTEALTVPDGCCYVLGDNRSESLDSRFWDDPFVSEDEIIGKVFFRIFPDFGKIGCKE